ncbi:MAG: TonB-dependent receptor, partial [Candidatus Brocadia sp.]
VDITKGNYLFMNYTYQNPEDNRGNDLPFVAKHYGNFGVNVQPWRYINTNLSAFISGSRARDGDDPDEDRDDLPSYALLNLSLIAREFFKTMEVQGTVLNLLDKDYSDPGPVSIPDDLPRPGRTFFVGLSYQF